MEILYDKLPDKVVYILSINPERIYMCMDGGAWIVGAMGTIHVIIVYHYPQGLIRMLTGHIG